jgi:hypothetical protein
MDGLHQQIMNIPCKVAPGYSDKYRTAYQFGHRDARHAAAELVAAHQSDMATELSACREENGRLRASNLKLHNSLLTRNCELDATEDRAKSGESANAQLRAELVEHLERELLRLTNAYGAKPPRDGWIEPLLADAANAAKKLVELGIYEVENDRLDRPAYYRRKA